MKWLVTVDSSEEEPKDIPHVGISHDDYEEMSDKFLMLQKRVECAVGDNTRGGFDNFAVYKPLYSSQYRVKPFREMYS